MEKSKDMKTPSFPTEDESLAQDVLDTFSIDIKQMLTILDELQKKRDSFSIAHVANMLDMPVDYAESFASFMILTSHFITAHGLKLESLEKSLLKLGCDKNNVSAIISKLREFDEQIRKDIEKRYWLEIELLSEKSMSDVHFEVSYKSLEDEAGQFIGIAPVIKLGLHMISDNDESEVFSMHIGLDDLKVLIKRLQEINREASNTVKKLKVDLKDKLICVPSE